MRREAYILREILIIPDLLSILNASSNMSVRTLPNSKFVFPDHNGRPQGVAPTTDLGCC